MILKENKNKAGIYKFTNKLNGNFYIGSSVNLSRRFTNYFSLSYISKVKNHLTISRAIIKYGYSNFELEILKYCAGSNLLIREQYYIDNLKPIYNISKTAGSTLGVIKSKVQRDNISKALKGKYTGEKSSLFGRSHNSETKKLMSLAKSGCFTTKILYMEKLII
jgi:group I intron endonuclease